MSRASWSRIDRCASASSDARRLVGNDGQLDPFGIGAARFDRREAGLDLFLDRIGVDVADDDHRCVVGAVPVVVEARQCFGGDRLDRFAATDRKMPFVRRPREDEAGVAIEDAAIGGLDPCPPFVEDDAPFGLDVVRVDRRCGQPVLENVERRADRIRRIGHVQCVDRLVVAGARIDVGAERSSETSQHVDEFVLRESLGAVEQHVFEEVGPTDLVLVLEPGTRIDDESEFDLATGVVVRAHEIAQPVVECALGGGRVAPTEARKTCRVGSFDSSRRADRVGNGALRGRRDGRVLVHLHRLLDAHAGTRRACGSRNECRHRRLPRDRCDRSSDSWCPHRS
jgi:hypothetical protein